MLMILGLLACSEVPPERVARTYVDLVTSRDDTHPAMHLLVPNCTRPHTLPFDNIDLITPMLLDQTETQAVVRVTVAFYPDGQAGRAIDGIELGLVKLNGLWRVRCPADKANTVNVLKIMGQH